MSDVSTLIVELHGKPIGTLTRFPDDRTLFAFAKDYIDDDQRPTLSLSFKDIYGGLDTDTKPIWARVPSFFANLLPEGHLRTYLAGRTGVDERRDFSLLSALGSDLPGAIRTLPADGEGWPEDDVGNNNEGDAIPETILRFSLAGVQLKFSPIKSAGNLTIPTNGIGGSWIVKLPSETHDGLPENEFSMMELARRTGIDVPEAKLVDLKQIEGLPSDVLSVGAKAFVIKRFDRLEDGTRIHIEDFAQIFGLYPERKYERANYDKIASVLAAETGDEGVAEFVRRFTFNALIGNGDMHLKNWSVIYPDKRKAAIAPAYDFVSTLLYIPNEGLALNFADSKAFADLDLARFERFADKAKLSDTLVRDTVLQTVERFHAVWSERADLPIPADIEAAIAAHLETVPIAKGRG